VNLVDVCTHDRLRLKAIGSYIRIARYLCDSWASCSVTCMHTHGQTTSKTTPCFANAHCWQVTCYFS